MRQSGDELVESLGIGAGMAVLDLGCGDGTTALPAARRGADVLGVNIASNLVEAGNRRAVEAGLSNLRFQQGDASKLSEIPDRSFDLVLSIFGAMFAPDPFDVASEMVRVTRPGGRIIMGNWISGDPTLIAQVLKTSAAYSPAPPAGFVSPVAWGIEETVLERFSAAGIPRENIRCSRATYVFRSPLAPCELFETFRDFYGPTMNAFEAADRKGRAADLEAELVELLEGHNEAGSNGSHIPATFLKVEATRP